MRNRAADSIRQELRCRAQLRLRTFLLALNFFEEPRAAEIPPAISGRNGNPEHVRGLCGREADEVAQLDQFGFSLVLSRKLLERVTDSEQFVILPGGSDFNQVDVDFCLAAAVTDRVFTPGILDQYAPHGFCRGAEEVRAAIPFWISVADHPKPRFVNERGGLERLPGGFFRHLVRGKSAEFIVYERKQLIGSPGIPLFNTLQDVRDVAHGPSLAW
jgi:hypothetical protein